jgi:hypothetical protein
MKTFLLLGSCWAMVGSPSFAQSIADEEVPGEAGEAGEAGEEAVEESASEEEAGEESASEAEAPEGQQNTDIDLLQTEAIRAPELTGNQIDWLKPKRELMNQVPRAQVDFTAYTLEFGEVKIGLANVLVGIAPRVQLGTSPALFALGIRNVNGKINPLRFGRFDLATEASYYSLPLGDFRLTYTGVGGRVSGQVSGPVSLHIGGTFNRIQGGGTPDISELNPLFLGTTQTELDEWAELVDETGAAVDLDANIYTINFAADWRFNRRDSLIFQAGAWLNVNASAEVNVPPIAGLEEAFNESRDYDLGDAYMASLAYHIAGKHWEFRFGVGLSSASWAWLLQSTDMSYRNGGATRMSEWRTRKTWRKNAGDVQN